MVKYALKIFEKNLQLMLDISVCKASDKNLLNNVTSCNIIIEAIA